MAILSIISREMRAEVQMPWRRSSRVDPDRSEVMTMRYPLRCGGASSRGRRHRPGIECLEDRTLLGPLTESPIPAPSDPSGARTVGPDGNLWFSENLLFPRFAPPQTGRIGRITPA